MSVAATQHYYNSLLFFVLRQSGAEGTTIHHLIKQSNQLFKPSQSGICHGTFALIHQVRDVDPLAQQVFNPLIFLRDLKQQFLVPAQPTLIEPIGQLSCLGRI